MSRRTTTAAIDSVWQSYWEAAPPSDEVDPLPLGELFPKRPDAPAELEIGPGKGLFLERQALRYPEINLVGIEWSPKFSRLAAGRLVARDIPNVRVIHADARRLLPRFPVACFRAVHVYFPDPWWKKRHKKRIMISPETTTQVLRVLQPGGELRLASDVAEHFDAMIEVLAEFAALERLPDPEPWEPRDPLDYLTHFERKYRLEGRSIHRAAFRHAGPR